MDAKNFQREYSLLFMPLCMYALRITGDIDYSRDAVQSAFEEAWKRVEEIAVLKPYMYRAVRHNALRYTVSDPLPADYEEVSEEDVDTSERDARLWRAIDALPARCREVFLLSKRDGLSNAEIAEELGVSPKTVENQMTKAFSRLRSLLDERRRLRSEIYFLPYL